MNLYFQLQLTGEVLLAMFFGAISGFDRERASKPAGLRTHMLVAAALLVGITDVLVERFNVEVQGQTVRTADPIRIIEAIIT